MDFNRATRLLPAYLAFAPAIFFVVVLAIGTSAWWSKIGGIAVACGAPLFVQQFGRAAGKRKEPELMASWAAPTTVLLRHRSPANNPSSLRHRHEAVKAATGILLPSAAEEERNPVAADGTYDAAVRKLRELTRDHDKFPLVFDELVNYGFRRNLWGLKPLGIALAIIVALVSGALLIWELTRGTQFAAVSIGLCLGFALIVLATWGLVVTREWVKQAAFSYGERLLAAAEVIPRKL